MDDMYKAKKDNVLKLRKEKQNSNLDAQDMFILLKSMMNHKINECNK